MKLPEALKVKYEDQFYGKKRPLYRKVSGNARLTIFNGAHEIIHLAGLNWLANQRKGKAAVWKIKEYSKLKSSEAESQSNK